MKINIIKKNIKNIKNLDYIKIILITKKNAEINVKITKKLDIKNLNKKYKNKNKYTDVLTFKNNNIVKQKIIGDIILCLEIINYEKNTLENIIIHSILHILDYNHEKNKDYKIMKRVEKKIGMSGIEPPTITTSK